MNTIIESTTEAAQSESMDINIDNKYISPAGFKYKQYPQGTTFRVISGSLGAGEYVTLEYNDGTAWRTANIAGNDGKILNENNACATIYGRMTKVRVNKSVTASALGVEVC